MHFLFWLPVILIGGMLRVAAGDAEESASDYFSSGSTPSSKGAAAINVFSTDEQIEPRYSSGSIAHRAGALTIQRGQS